MQFFLSPLEENASRSKVSCVESSTMMFLILIRDALYMTYCGETLLTLLHSALQKLVRLIETIALYFLRSDLSLDP